MNEDVDPDNPQPDGHYHVDREATWYLVDGDLAPTIAAGPATNAEPGDDWVLSFTPS